VPERLDASVMAQRVAREFSDGAIVNLGVGLPLLCGDAILPDREILFHSENGILGFGPVITNPDEADLTLTNAGGHPVSQRAGMTLIQSHDESFAMIRGGHIDISVLGALQVSAAGDLANTHQPGKVSGNIGGAQDLATCAKKVIVMMYHTTTRGEPKILQECVLPLTARACVDMIVTDVAVLEPANGKVLLREFAPGWSIEEIQAITGAPLMIANGLCEYTLI
jgi:3-oxoacid CoA-transferase subunit B